MRNNSRCYPLLVSNLFRYSKSSYPNSQVITYNGDSIKHNSFADVAVRVEKLANALNRLGIKKGDRVATLAMNHQEHLECYLAIPSMGAILHTLNLKLFSDQLSYIIQDAEDKVIIFDAQYSTILETVLDSITHVKYFIAIGDGDFSKLRNVIRYEQLLADEPLGFDWPDLDECDIAALCYTSGTTGDPKGVEYSHRSIYLHTQMINSASCFALTSHDKALILASMFHGLAWGTLYAYWTAGADMLLPGDFLQANHIIKFINAERPTIGIAICAIWKDVLVSAEKIDLDLSSVRILFTGGTAVPRQLVESYYNRYNVKMVQVWGGTESLICTLSFPPKNVIKEEEIDWLIKTGKIVTGIELRITDGKGNVLPNDGEAIGELEVKGSWVATSYFKNANEDRFRDYWYRTGDIGTCTPDGNVQISDRIKDVIKSGGEWISSVELENKIGLHEAVDEVAVVAIPDDKWDERPLVCVTLKEGRSFDPQVLSNWLAPQITRWCLPEHWTQLNKLPKTSVGKVDKKVLRKLFDDNELEVITVQKSSL